MYMHKIFNGSSGARGTPGYPGIWGYCPKCGGIIKFLNNEYYCC